MIIIVEKSLQTVFILPEVVAIVLAVVVIIVAVIAFLMYSMVRYLH